ncbi:MAG: alpha/beta hydrolase domain-containing protein [Steroidobacterales bacterium]
MRPAVSRLCRVGKLIGAAILCTATCAAFGHVLRVEVTSREDVLRGVAFDRSGAYERITGRVIFAVAVANPHNRPIVDLADAVNLKDGAVEFSADVVILRPKDAAKGNGTLLLEVPNRGQSAIVRIVDGGDRDAGADAGDGWLLRHGYSTASLGWQWDATGHTALRLYAPIARDHGRTISGLLRGDVMPSEARDDLPLGHLIIGTVGGSEYPVAAPEDPRNSLTVRASRTAERELIPRDQWSFAHLVNGRLEPSMRHIHLNGGFKAGQIYEYVYAVADPVIAGLGFAAVRDFASYVKHSPQAIVSARRVIGEGISQNGRFLRDMIYQGFDADEQGRIALDGVLAHVAGAGRGSFNVRFAQPSRDAQPTSAIAFPTDIFPYTDLPETDPVTKQRDGLLVGAAAQRAVPRIFLSNTSYEYWGRVASLITTSADGQRDVDLSRSVRVYHFTGLQHFSGPWPPARGSGDLLGQQPQSPLPVKYFWRAMIANMDAWLRSATLPPPSRYPRIDDATLVPIHRYAFPEIPGASVPHDPSQAWRLDFGPRWRQGVQDVQPPIVGQAFPVLVPQVDPDGNERGGIRLPEFSAPLATYTPWNLRDASIGAPDQRVAFEGSFLPFAKDAATRQLAGDPRPSVSERYRDRGDYLERYTAALDALIRDRYLLAEDRAALLHSAGEEWDYAMP